MNLVCGLSTGPMLRIGRTKPAGDQQILAGWSDRTAMGRNQIKNRLRLVGTACRSDGIGIIDFHSRESNPVSGNL
jgi:hypothetical protein